MYAVYISINRTTSFVDHNSAHVISCWLPHHTSELTDKRGKKEEMSFRVIKTIATGIFGSDVSEELVLAAIHCFKCNSLASTVEEIVSCGYGPGQCIQCKCSNTTTKECKVASWAFCKICKTPFGSRNAESHRKCKKHQNNLADYNKTYKIEAIEDMDDLQFTVSGPIAET